MNWRPLVVLLIVCVGSFAWGWFVGWLLDVGHRQILRYVRRRLGLPDGYDGDH